MSDINLNQINQQRIATMTEKLVAALKPSEIDIDDESHLHAGHAGAKTGKGHFHLTIKSEQFIGLTPIKTHQLIYGALGELMQTDIHALRISILK
jgi:BolA protein